MRLTYETEPRAWRKFTLLTLPMPALLGGLLWWKGLLPLAAWGLLLGALALVAALAALRPEWFRGYYRAGHMAGFRLVQTIGYVALFLVFVLLVTPLGLALRLAGKDLLNLRRNRHADSYWQPARPPSSLDQLF